MKLPGFHTYDQSLQESIDWCTQEQARQNDQWLKIRERAKYVDITPYQSLLAEMKDEANAIRVRMKLLPQQMPLHVYRWRRSLLKSRNFLNELTIKAEG